MTKEEKYWVNRRLINDKIEKRCDLCKEWFEETSYNFYYLNKSKPERGFSSDCKQCAKKRARKWAVNNVEKKRESCRKNSRKPNILQYHKELSQRQRDSGMTKVWYQDKKDTYRGYVIKYESHKHHTISEKDWIRNKAFFDFKCAYCGMTLEEHKKIYKQKLHNDHVDEDGYNDLRNDVPACKRCNTSKHESELEDWYFKQKFFDKNKYNKLIWWITEGYKDYIQDKPPYKITRKQNEDKKTFHWELWSIDEMRNTIDYISKKPKKKDLDEDIEEYLNQLKHGNINFI